MINWVSAICQKAWHRIKHPLRNDVNKNRDLGIKVHISNRNDAKHPPEQGHHLKDLLSFPLKVSRLSGESVFTMVADCAQRKKEYESSGQRGYLLERENGDQDINKLSDILSMPHVLMEVGCGNAEAARQIARRNPNIGIIATDLYDWSHPQYSRSGYGQIARDWRAGQLQAQMNPLDNLVILRAETDLLQFFPLQAIDTVILINPEPLVGKAILALLQGESLSLKMKHGPMQIVILPYSREMGLMASGGCEFEHDPDWSRGLGFLMASGLQFKRGASTQWGVDLSRISAYTGNSTQQEIYVYGKQLI